MRNLNGEVTVFDAGVRPSRIHELRLRNYLPPRLDQSAEQCEAPVSHCDRRVAMKNAAPNVEQTDQMQTASAAWPESKPAADDFGGFGQISEVFGEAYTTRTDPTPILPASTDERSAIRTQERSLWRSWHQRQ